MRTGKLVDGPVSADVRAYETRVEGDTVYAEALTVLPGEADTSPALGRRSIQGANLAHPSQQAVADWGWRR